MEAPVKPPAEWLRWRDRFWLTNGRDAFWDEIVVAIQADARGEPEPRPMTDEEIAAASEQNRAPSPVSGTPW